MADGGIDADSTTSSSGSASAISTCGRTRKHGPISFYLQLVSIVGTLNISLCLILLLVCYRGFTTRNLPRNSHSCFCGPWPLANMGSQEDTGGTRFNSLHRDYAGGCATWRLAVSGRSTANVRIALRRHASCQGAGTLVTKNKSCKACKLPGTASAHC